MGGSVTTLYDNFANHKLYSGWRDVSGIATSRLPYALFGPTVVTHFPLFRTSSEDANFDRHAQHFSNFLAKNLYREFSAYEPGDIDKLRFSGIENLGAAALDKAIVTIWLACRE